MYSQYGWNYYETLENVETTPNSTLPTPISSTNQKNNLNQFIEYNDIEYNDIQVKECFCKQNNTLEFLSFVTLGTFIVLLVHYKH